MEERQAWIKRQAAKLAPALAGPAVRARLVALVAGDPADARRRRRLAELEGGVPATNHLPAATPKRRTQHASTRKEGGSPRP